MYSLYTPYRGNGVRSEDIENHLEISFDCGPHASFNRKPEFQGHGHIRCDSYSGTNLRTANGHLTIPEGMAAVALNYYGTLIARHTAHGPLVLIPPRSVLFARSSELLLQAARGDHQATVISWNLKSTPVLESWLARSGKSDPNMARSISCRPFSPFFLKSIDRLQDAIARPSESSELHVLSVVYEISAHLMLSPNLVQLSATPPDLPETVSELVTAVRENPVGPWPLRDAADRAGYSPFHFSRVFKGLVGYGFHEYVDRCRTEAAVRILVSSDKPVDKVAQIAGFGTTQGLRESIKEYLGLVPSELRSTNDGTSLNEEA